MSESGKEEQISNSESAEKRINVRQIFERALKISRETDKNPLMEVVGVLHPKPVAEWQASEYAHAIRNFADIVGNREDEHIADSVRRFLWETASNNGIDPMVLSKQIGAEHRPPRTLLDAYKSIEDALATLSDDERNVRVKAINEAMEGSAPPEPTERERMEQLHSQYDVRDPMLREQLEQSRRRDIEMKAKKRFFSERGEDIELYEGKISDTLEKRFERILTNPRHETEDKLRSYFADIQRWVGVVLQNDSRENPHDGNLILKNERYDRFKKIMEINRDDVSLEQLRDEVRYLQDMEEGRLTRYFISAEGDKMDRISSVIGVSPDTQLPSLPNSVEETMEIFQSQYGSKFATGGEYELIDMWGEFHIENFVYLARERTNWLREQNPTEKINPLSDITIRTVWSSIAIAEILQSPQFRKHRQFEISGDEREESEGRLDKTINGKWGKTVDHPKFNEDRTLDLLYELAFYAGDHSMAADWFLKRGDKQSFLEGANRHMQSWISRGNWTHIFKRPSRMEGGGKEFEDYYEKDADGTLGRALREMVGAYSKLTDFTEFYTYQKGDRRLELKDGVRREVGKRKIFKDNLLYKYLEADGTNTFLLSIAESSLAENGQVVEKYREFLGEQVKYTAKSYVKGLNAEQTRRLEQLVEKYVAKSGNVNGVSLDSPQLLLEFHTQVRKLVLNQKKVDKKDIELKTQEDMLKNLKKGFFTKVKTVEIPMYDPVTGRRLKDHATGKDAVKTLGDLIGKELDAFDDDIATYAKYVDYRRYGFAMPDITDGKFEEYVKKNEELAVKLAEVIAIRPRKELNYFRKAENHFSKTELLDTALRKGIAQKAFGLDMEEAKYVASWAKNMLFGFGIAGENDTSATGFDYWTRISRAGEYMEQQNMKGYPLVEGFIKEVNFLGSNVFDMLMVKRPGQAKAQMTMMDVFMGGVGDAIVNRDNRVLGPKSTYGVPANAQQGVLINNMRNASEFIDQLRNGKFNFDGISRVTPQGGIMIDKQKAIAEFTTLWTKIRYSTDQHGMDYTRLMSRDGKIDDVMHQQFGEKTRTLLEEMQNTLYKDDPMKMYTAPGIGVYVSLIGNIIEQHDGFKSDKKWTIEEINKLEYVISAIIHKDSRVKEYGTRIPPHIWDSMLIVTKLGGFRKMMAKEGLFTFFESLFYFFMEAIEESLEEVGRPLHK